jgi:hypothetical protein
MLTTKEGEPLRRETYLVGLVVVLWVVLKHLGSLLVVKSAHKLLDTDISVGSPPLLAVDEPARQSVTLFNLSRTMV